MGERITPTCDIFDTLQPKGLRTIRVSFIATVHKDETTTEEVPILNATLEVSKRGYDRVLRSVQAAISPPKTRTATDGEAAGNA